MPRRQALGRRRAIASGRTAFDVRDAMGGGSEQGLLTIAGGTPERAVHLRAGLLQVGGQPPHPGVFLARRDHRDAGIEDQVDRQHPHRRRREARAQPGLPRHPAADLRDLVQGDGQDGRKQPQDARQYGQAASTGTGKSP